MANLLDADFDPETNIQSVVIRLQEKATEEDFTLLYNEYSNKVYSRCVYYTGNNDEAGDVFQHIWIKVHLKIREFQGKSSFSSWLYRITTNQCLDYLKARSRDRDLFTSRDQENYDENDEVEDTHENVFLEQDVTNALLQSSKDMRALLVMKYFDNYTYDEIAEMTNLSPSAVKMRISRGKKDLLMLLDNY